MFLVDTNVLLDIFTDDERWRPWSERAVAVAVVYAEASLTFGDAETLDRSLNALLVERLPLPWGAAFEAGRAYRRYRHAGGARTSPLPDFYIGAHAATDGLPLVTRDAGPYCTYFPSVRLVTPGPHD